MNDDELRSMTGGDRGLAKAVRASLERLRGGAGSPQMQELARDVLDGRISLRQVARSDVYGDAFREQFRKVAEWRESIGEEEYERQVERARRQLDELGDDASPDWQGHG
jgi:hypothetical protein